MARRALPFSRMYQATLPVAIHAALRCEAAEIARNGGQVNINKVIVQRLYMSMTEALTPAARKATEDFIRNL